MLHELHESSEQGYWDLWKTNSSHIKTPILYFKKKKHSIKGKEDYIDRIIRLTDEQDWMKIRTW